MIRKYNENDIPILNRMFAQAAKDELLFKPFTDEYFRYFFTTDTPGVTKELLISEENGEINGYASGCTVSERDVGYITFVYALPAERRKNVASGLLCALEDALKADKPEITRYEIVFYNPMGFEWYIPGGNGADHPCAPGVDMASDAFIFFKNNGYRCYAYQNSYYQPLIGYEYPDDIKKKIEGLKERDIEITYYDGTKHKGLAELFDNIKEPGWKKAILANDARGENANPLLVAVYKGELVVGYTGPLSVAKSGRGCFHGIGVHTDYRRFGAGKVLFSSLCMALKDMGATFMSLYTGEDMAARNIYEAVGFRIVRCLG